MSQYDGCPLIAAAFNGIIQFGKLKMLFRPTGFLSSLVLLFCTHGIKQNVMDKMTYYHCEYKMCDQLLHRFRFSLYFACSNTYIIFFKCVTL